MSLIRLASFRFLCSDCSKKCYYKNPGWSNSSAHSVQKFEGPLHPILYIVVVVCCGFSSTSLFPDASYHHSGYLQPWHCACHLTFVYQSISFMPMFIHTVGIDPAISYLSIFLIPQFHLAIFQRAGRAKSNRWSRQAWRKAPPHARELCLSSCSTLP